LYALQGVNKLTGGDGEDIYVFTGQLGVNTLLETGRQASRLDFSGFLPPEILGVVGPLPTSPTVSVPSNFSVVRGTASRLFFFGTPFVGGVSDATVTLSTPAGAFTAKSANGVTVEGDGKSKISLTGSMANLNRYFTSGAIAYRFDAAVDTQQLQVELVQGDLSAEVSASIKVVGTSSSTQNWRDMAATDALLVAVGQPGADQVGVHLSRALGKTWTPAELPKGMGFDSVSIADDGRRIAAFSFSGDLALSNDAGLSWTVRKKAPADNYSESLVLDDGRVLAGDLTAREWYFNNNFDWGQRNTPA